MESWGDLVVGIVLGVDKPHLAGNQRDEVLQTQGYAKSSSWKRGLGFQLAAFQPPPCLLQIPLWSALPLPAPFSARRLGLGEACGTQPHPWGAW